MKHFDPHVEWPQVLNTKSAVSIENGLELGIEVRYYSILITIQPAPSTSHDATRYKIGEWRIRIKKFLRIKFTIIFFENLSFKIELKMYIKLTRNKLGINIELKYIISGIER